MDYSANADDWVNRDRGRERGGAQRRGPTIGLALGGGGARGLAHILVLEVLDEMNIRPDVISGTSIGALIGAAYAAGLTGREIRAYARKKLARRGAFFRELIANRGAPLTKMLGTLQLRSALLKADALLDLVLPPDLNIQIEDLSIPMHIVATDFYNQSERVFTSGSLRSAVAASIAVPVIMSPVEHNGAMFVDGGLVNPLPYDVISSEVDIVIAVDVLGGGEGNSRAFERGKNRPSAMGALVGSSQILQRSIIREKLKSSQPDILLALDTGKNHAADFMKLEKILEAAAPAREELRRKLTRVLGAQTLAARDAGAGGNDLDPSSTACSKQGQGHSRLAERLMGRG